MDAAIRFYDEVGSTAVPDAVPPATFAEVPLADTTTPVVPLTE